jgi:hypothetical protein
VPIDRVDEKVGIPEEGRTIAVAPGTGLLTESETIPIEFPVGLTCTWAEIAPPWTTVPDEGEIVMRKLLEVVEEQEEVDEVVDEVDEVDDEVDEVDFVVVVLPEVEEEEVVV